MSHALEPRTATRQYVAPSSLPCTVPVATTQPTSTAQVDTGFMLVSADGARVCRADGQLRLGRHPSSDLVVADDRVSSEHCVLAREAAAPTSSPPPPPPQNPTIGPDGVMVPPPPNEANAAMPPPRVGHVVLEDRSQNGTFVNGRRVGRQHVRLVSGDEVGIVLVRRASAASSSLGGASGATYVERFLFHDFSGLIRPASTSATARTGSDVAGPTALRLSPSRRVQRSASVHSWQLGSEIGRGAHGTVHVGLNTRTGELLAVKKVSKNGISPTSTPVTTATNERELLSTLQHRRIVQFLGCEETVDEYILFLEYVSGGNLAQLIDHFGSFDESVVRLYALQILQGLEFLHGKGIVHGDVKPANILINDKGEVKLSDFGTSRILGKEVSFTNISGTPRWMSPDMVKCSTASFASDLWAFGCVVLEMASGYPPWHDFETDNAFALVYHIGNAVQGPSLEALHGCSGLLLDFVSQCLHLDPTDRPSATEMLHHGFLREPSPSAMAVATHTPVQEDSLASAVGISAPLQTTAGGLEGRSRSTVGDHRAFLERAQVVVRAPGSVVDSSTPPPGQLTPPRSAMGRKRPLPTASAPPASSAGTHSGLTDNLANMQLGMRAGAPAAEDDESPPLRRMHRTEGNASTAVPSHVGGERDGTVAFPAST